MADPMTQYQERFLMMLSQMGSDEERMTFLNWVKEVATPQIEASTDPGYANLISGREKLHQVSQAVLDLMPNREAIFPSEKVTFPTRFAADDDDHLTKENTIFVDAFLYDAAAEEAMVDEGILPTAFCNVCGSKDTQNFTYITHSCSKDVLEIIFTSLLPELPPDAVVLDVGSRLGAVIYGAYLFTPAKYIVGLEMNSELCQLQSQVCQKFAMTDRVQIECSEMTTRADLFVSADVVILNNVFEFFVSEEGGAREGMWTFLRTAMRPGTLIVSSPAIEKSLSTINTGIDVESWLEELPPSRPVSASCPSAEKKTEDQSAEFHLYRVKS